MFQWDVSYFYRKGEDLRSHGQFEKISNAEETLNVKISENPFQHSFLLPIID